MDRTNDSNRLTTLKDTSFLRLLSNVCLLYAFLLTCMQKVRNVIKVFIEVLMNGHTLGLLCHKKKKTAAWTHEHIIMHPISLYQRRMVQRITGNHFFDQYLDSAMYRGEY